MNNSDCIILHPQRTIKDILKYTGLVRHLYTVHAGNVILLSLPEYYNLLKNNYFDLEKIIIEKIPNLSDSTFLKLFIGKFKSIRVRHFFGLCDKFRTDTLKKKAESDDIDPYLTYGYDPEMVYTHFKINMNEERRSKLMFQIKTVANMNYNMTSKAEYVPVEYKRNAMVSLNVDTMFNNTNFLDSTELIKFSKALYLTNSPEDDFTLLIYMMTKCKLYDDILSSKKILLFKPKEEPLKYTDLPEWWKIV